MAHKQTDDILLERVAALQKELRFTKKKLVSLQKSEKLYRLVVDNARDAIYLMDVDSKRIINANKTAQDMMGRSIEEIHGFNIFNAVIVKETDISKARLQRLLNGETLEPQEYTLVSNNGRKIPVEAKSFLIELGDRKIAVNIHRDISHRKEAEEILRESEESRNALLNATTESSLLVDLEGTILAINQVGAARLGGSVDELTGMAIERYVPAEKVKKRKELHKYIYRSGKPVQFQDEREGRIREFSLHPVFNKNKEVVAIAIFGRDITQRIQAEMKLRESEKTARALLNIPNIVAALVDPDCNIIDANDFMAKRFDMRREELIGKNFLDLIPKEVAERRKKIHDHVLQSGKLMSAEDERGGVWFDTIYNPILDESGNVSRVAVIARDISMQKQAEIQLKESVKEKEVLIREIHHRVKNNMQIINSLLQLQALHSNDQKVNEMFEESRNRINTMALVHEKLYQSDKISKINIGQYIRDLGKNLFESFKVNTGKVSFKSEIADISLPINRAIPLGLVLNELISNSLKYAFSDGRDGEIFIKFCPTAGDEVELTVRDNGIGLSTEAETINGKTLGLKLIKTLVEKQLNGKIDIDHEQGTQYRIRFLNT